MSFSTKSVVFDGVSGYVDMGNSPVFQLEYTDAFSISCWAKTRAVVSSTLVAKMNGTTGVGYSLYLNSSGQLEALLQGSSTARHVRTDSSRYNDGGWHHFVMAYDGSAVPTLYVDGIAKTTTTVQNDISSSILTGTHLQVGAYDGATDPFDGSIDEVSIHNAELTASEVLDIFASAKPVDITSFGHYSPLTTSIDFDGVDEYVDFGNKPEFHVAGDPPSFSLGIWFKTTNPAYQCLISKQPVYDTYAGFRIEMTSTYIRYTNARGPISPLWRYSYISKNHTGHTDGNWHQIIGVWDATGGGISRFYLDGVNMGSVTSGSSSSQEEHTEYTANLLVGRRDAQVYERWFDGQLCHSFIYDKPLSDAEAAAIYGDGAPQDLASVGPISNLRHWSALGDGDALGTGNILDISGYENDGTFVNGESGDFLLDVPMAANNIIGWWKMGDGDTYPTLSNRVSTDVFPTIPDDSPSGNNGTAINMELSNVTADVPGGRSCVFNGSDEYVTMGDVLGFERTNAFSLSCWIKTTSGGGGLITKQLNTGTYRGYYLGVSTTEPGRVVWIIRNDQTSSNRVFVQTARTNLNDNQWHLITATWDGTSTAAGTKIYVDGAEDTSIVQDNLSATILTTAHFNISGRDSGGIPFNGRIDDCAVYDKELSSAEVTAIYNSGTPNDLRDLSSASNLVGYWRMGDGATPPTIPIAIDYLTDYSPLTQAIYFNEAGVFTDQILMVETSLNYLSQNHAFSVGLWVNYTTSAGGILFNKYYAGGPYGWYVRDTGSGTLRAYFRAAGLDIYKDFASTGINDGAWHHVLFTFDGSANISGAKLYLDGSELTPTTTVGTTIGNIATTTLFGVGKAQNWGSFLFEGKVLHWGIWTAELTPAEVTAVYGGGFPQDLLSVGPTTDLKVWMSLGDGSTHATRGLPDLSGNSNEGTWWDSAGGFTSDIPTRANGTMVNMDATNFVDGVPGLYSIVSLGFNGSDEYVNVGDVLGFDRTDPFTFSAWVKTSLSGTPQTIVSKMQPSLARGYDFSIDASGQLLLLLVNDFNGANRLAVTAGTVNDGSWHYVVVSHDGSGTVAGVTFYIDGVVSTPSTIYDTLSATILTTVPFEVGRRNQAGPYQYFNGSIDEILIYDIELTASQVSDLYAFGAPVDPTALDSWSDAVGYWKMGEVPPTDGAMTNMDSDDLVTNAPKNPGLIGQPINYYTMRGLAATNPAVYHHWTVIGSPDFSGAQAGSIPAVTTYSPLTTCIDFNGSFPYDEYCNFSSPLTIPATGQAFTEVFWFKSSVVTNHVPWSKSAVVSGRSWAVRITNNRITLLYTDGSSTWSGRYYDAAATMVDGSWHFIAVVHDGSDVTNAVIYIDGTPHSTGGTSYSMDAPTTDSRYVFGGMWGASTLSFPVRGKLCHGALYDKALSTAELNAIYGGGVPQDLSAVGPISNLKHWCALGDGDAIGAGNIIDLALGNNGEFINGEAGDFVSDVPSNPSTDITSFSDITVVGHWKANE